MKTKIMKMLKKAGAGLLAVTMVVVGSGVTSLVADAATKPGITNVIEYQEVEYKDCKNYIAAKEAPQFKAVAGVDDSYGYLFAGWYTAKSDAPENKITADTTGIADNAIVYAKFVPAYVMSVKCQNLSTTTSGSQSTTIRLLSSLDSPSYSAFGFRVEKLTANADGSYTETLLAEKNVSEIFSGGINIYSGTTPTTYTAAQVFGNNSTYAAGVKLTGVTDFAAIYSVQPYWVTFDGTRVYGLARYTHVEDGLNGYINVPVNLKSVDAVAAGVLSVDCSSLPDGYTLKDVEAGATFQVSAKDKGNNVIKCVGNVADITKNADSSDLFVNLRFAKAGGTEKRIFDGNFYLFTVSGEEFCDNTEKTLKDYTVWNVQY